MISCNCFFHDFRVSSGGKNLCSQRDISDGIYGNFLKAPLEFYFVGGILHRYASYRVNTSNLSLARDRADASINQVIRLKFERGKISIFKNYNKVFKLIDKA